MATERSLLRSMHITVLLMICLLLPAVPLAASAAADSGWEASVTLTEAVTPEEQVATLERQLQWWISALALVLVILFATLFLLIITMRNLNLQQNRESRITDTTERLINLLSIPICVTASSGRIMIANQPFSRLLDMPHETITEENLYQILPKDEENLFRDLIREARNVRKTGIPYSMPMQKYRRDDGFSAWLEISISPFDWYGESALLIRALDLSRQKETEERLRHVEKMQAIGQLAGGVAHDFNNQLMAIQGYANLLTERLSGENREYIMLIKQAADNSKELTRQLLAFSRKGTFRESLIDIGNEINTVIALLSRSLDRKIVLKRELPDTPIQIKGDATLLQNALLNLGINSRDAMPTGGTIRFTAEIVQVEENEIHWLNGILPAGTYAAITIADTGSGIARHIIPKIFEPFFTTKPSGAGTGMGLPAVLGTVSRHNGAITVKSSTRGTSFTIYLPYSEEVSETETLPEKKPGITAVGEKNILICDDEQVIRLLVKNILTRAGHSVTSSADGLEAIKIFTEFPETFDLVILDMIMPIMSGEEAFRKIREIRPTVPVIIISGYSEIEHSSALLKAGLNAFLAKPISPDDLNMTIQKIFEEA